MQNSGFQCGLFIQIYHFALDRLERGTGWQAKPQGSFSNKWKYLQLAWSCQTKVGVVTPRGEPVDGFSQGEGAEVKGNHPELGSALLPPACETENEHDLLHTTLNMRDLESQAGFASPAWLGLGWRPAVFVSIPLCPCFLLLHPLSSC